MSVSKLLSSCQKRWGLYISLNMMRCSTVHKIQGNSELTAEREEKHLNGKIVIYKGLWATFSASKVQTRHSADQTTAFIATPRGDESLIVQTTKYQAEFAVLKSAACFKEDSTMPGDRSVSFSMGVLFQVGTQNTAMNTICKHSLYRFIIRLCVYGRV